MSQASQEIINASNDSGGSDGLAVRRLDFIFIPHSIYSILNRTEFDLSYLLYIEYPAIVRHLERNLLQYVNNV